MPREVDAQHALDATLQISGLRKLKIARCARGGIRDDLSRISLTLHAGYEERVFPVLALI
jgi:hypothetical protein